MLEKQVVSNNSTRHFLQDTSPKRASRVVSFDQKMDVLQYVTRPSQIQPSLDIRQRLF